MPSSLCRVSSFSLATHHSKIDTRHPELNKCKVQPGHRLLPTFLPPGNGHLGVVIAIGVGERKGTKRLRLVLFEFLNRFRSIPCSLCRASIAAAHDQDNITLLVPGFDMPMGHGSLFERICSVNDSPDLSCFSQASDENQVPGLVRSRPQAGQGDLRPFSSDHSCPERLQNDSRGKYG